MTVCKTCGRSYKYERVKGHHRAECNSCVVNKQRGKNKERAITYLGGKCKHCGYNKCHRALSFHHRDPKLKKFAITGNHCRNWERLKLELDKCDLLCLNCHMEEEDRLHKTR